MPLPKHPWLYKAVSKAIASFGKRHHVTERQHFAPMIGLTGSNGDIQFSTILNYTTYNPAAPKPLSSDQLVVLLDELGDDRKIILDAIAKQYDGVFVFSADAEDTAPESIKDELLLISSFAGNLSAKFLEHHNDDGMIDDAEADELMHIAYKARQRIKTFEEMVEKSKLRVKGEE